MVSASIAASTAGSGGYEAAVGAELDILRTARVRFVAPLLLGLIMLFDSWDSIAIAYVMPSLVGQWHLTPVAVGFLISAGYAGQFVGAIWLGTIAERYGRMPVFIGAIASMGVLALACSLAPSYAPLFGLRFVQGIAIGGALPISITYINELAPSATRGRYFAIFQFITMSGYAAASLSSTIVVPHLGWRWMFGLGASPLLLLPLVMLLLPESPRWLARRGRMSEANEALAKLGGGPADALVDASSGAAAEAPARIPMTILFSLEFRRRTAIVMLLWFFISFASFGLTTWVPSIYVTVFHIPVAKALRYSATASLLFLIVSPTIAVFIDVVGRRPIAMTGTFVAAVALLTLGLARPTSTEILVPLVIAGQLSIYAAAIVIWPYTAETYPTHVRALGLGLSSSIARAASTLTPVAVGAILGSGAPVALVFGLFGTCALAAFILWLTATRETAKLRLENV